MYTHDFKAFFDHSTDLLSITSFDGYFLELNNQWSNVLGFSQEELTTAPFLDFVHPEDREKTAQRVQDFLAGLPRKSHFENRYKTKSGEDVWLEWNSTLDNEKRIIYSVARDITAFKKREEVERQFSKIVLEHSKLSTLDTLNIDDFTQCLLNATIGLFEVDSVSYWRLSTDRRKIYCTHSAERDNAIPRKNKELLEMDAPRYFEGILSNKIISADDARIHPSTTEFNSGYLQSFDVCSMLDAQVTGESGLWGIICLESSVILKWSVDEQNRLLSLASVLSIALLNDERNKSNQRLERLSNILDNVNEGVFITDARGELTLMNRGFERMTGYETSELRGLDMEAMLQMFQTDLGHSNLILEGIQMEAPFKQEMRLHTKAGVRIWTELSIAPFYQQEGKLEGFYGFQMDITRRKQAETEREKLNRYFQQHHRLSTQQALDSTALMQAYVELGLELFQLETGVISRINGNSYEIYAEASQLEEPYRIGESYSLENTLCQALIKKGQAIATNNVPESAVGLHTVQKNEGVIAYIGAPIFVNDEIYGILNYSSQHHRATDFSEKEISLLELMAHDLSKRLEADHTQHQLRESEERYRSVVDALSEGIVMQDTQDAVTMCNEAAASILGLTTDQLIGKDSYDPRWKALDMKGDPISPEDHPSMVTSKTGKPVRGFLMDVWKADGERSIISINSEPVINELGERYAVVASFSDVTAQKEAELSLKKALAEKNLLFRELHHRIKNNLNMVNNLLYLRARFTENEELMDFIKDTQNRILSIAKTYDLLLKLEEFDRLHTKAYIDDLLTSLVRIYATHPDRYELKIAIENHKLDVDKVATLGLLVFEIVTNIFKYAYDQNEGGVVTVDLEKVNDRLELKVSDKGKGLDSQKYMNGSSMGMSLIKAFVAQLKGDLQIEGEGGVSYLISFPMT
ncbi:MAG: PAS domain S-box protein [Cytophagales bacterium]|nr:PAS domain S-box protein [Cytophagales bacterium]